jgi:SNF2 family DNA or RNA helicase
MDRLTSEQQVRPLVLRMTGATKTKDRLTAVSRFNNHAGPAVFLMSLKACGVGINLTSATRAIICEPAWNPMRTAQAAARCYRIGQTQPVHIYRLVCNGTFEAKIQVRAALVRVGIKMLFGL